MSEVREVKFDLIVTIINKGFAEEVVRAARKAGAEGGTIITGRGSGSPENTKLFGVPIEPEKEIVLTLISRNKTEKVLEAISTAAELNNPSNGVAFVLKIEKAVGISSILEE